MPSSEYEAVNSVNESAHLIVTVCSLISLLVTVASCVCCRKGRLRDDNAINGVTNPTTTATTLTDSSAPHFVQGRPTIRIEKVAERPVQRTLECDRPTSEGALVKLSVALQTGRALPKLPLDMYTAIRKNHKANVAFFDEDGNPTYESIDPESDSLIDPLYTKASFQLFCVLRHNEILKPTLVSSIISEPHRSATVADQDDYNSSVYDGGYAKVKQGPVDPNWRRERLERTELEVDQLYSKIRRSSNIDDTVSVTEPSQLEADNKVVDHFGSEIPPECSKNVDSSSVSSREPSYRYITVRENADVVRERLRLHGQLALPAREHYYSVIGNEYETVGDVHSTNAYSAVDLPRSQEMINISTTFSPEFVPPPPTSPIPDRTPDDVAAAVATDVQQPSSSGIHDVSVPLYAVVSKPKVTTLGVGTSADDAIGLNPRQEAAFDTVEHSAFGDTNFGGVRTMKEGRKSVEVKRANCNKIPPHSQGVNRSRSADTSFSKTLR
ncbi:hypothetical protein ANCCEY_01740 [Ancylostoma ceylanicum]|uniref:Uncharacterized protein n=1 Tax=Ancylostoma ceylanicum TaxID=53326 RepID=A0A0D6M6T2_9BILA|nr:hypothetical protein ANCCEY_01740 [Ancylostoma ceylanicum]